MMFSKLFKRMSSSKVFGQYTDSQKQQANKLEESVKNTLDCLNNIDDTVFEDYECGDLLEELIYVYEIFLNQTESKQYEKSN